MISSQAQASIVAADIATIPAISVTTNDDLATAMSLINDNGIERLPVVRENDETNTVAPAAFTAETADVYVSLTLTDDDRVILAAAEREVA